MSYLAELAQSVKRYEPSDKTSLREFQRAYYGPNSRHCDDAFQQWLFQDNPHRDPEGPSLWLCKRDGAVVGQVGSIPVILKVREVEQRAAWLINWMIHPQWRLKGVASVLLNTTTANTELMIGLGLEDTAYKTVSRAGWQEIGRLSLFVRPLDPEACAKMLNIPRVFSKLAPRFVVGGSAHAIRRVASAVTRLSIVHIPAFDERVDALWESANPEYPILVKRDLTSLRWRFDEGPLRTLYDRYYLMRKGDVIGYAVVRLENRRGQVIGRVVDYLTPRRCIRTLLALVIGELHAKGAVAVFFEQWLPGSPAVLRSLGCLRMRASHRFMFKLRDGASRLAHELSEADSWFLVPGDSDFDHVLLSPQSHG